MSKVNTYVALYPVTPATAAGIEAVLAAGGIPMSGATETVVRELSVETDTDTDEEET